MKLTNIFIFVLMLSVIISGCTSENAASQPESAEIDTSQTQTMLVQPKTESVRRVESEDVIKPPEETLNIIVNDPEADTPDTEIAQLSPTIVYPDWAAYFGDLNGAAVILDPDENTCLIYNESLAGTRRSPCSTFKIISSLAGLESGIIDPDHSTRSWSGEVFWKDDWNQDMDFAKAFRTSCVWYYRQVIDDIGSDTMQDTLDSLHYGNCDISDWEGHLNNNNQNPALTGFWIESSLKISPREQAAVMEQIFGPSSDYSPTILDTLEEVMFLSQESEDGCAIYGKTGMGKSNGVVVDAWYTGFADIGRRVYFCVYLGEAEEQNVSSTLAREIAVSLIKENFTD